MYGLPQAGLLSHKRLVLYLDGYVYEPVAHTSGLWHHRKNPITFTLVIGNFGVKYVGREHAEHLHSQIFTK